MSPTLPSIRPLLQFADAHPPRSADYPGLPRILIGGTTCLGKRAFDFDTSLETYSPRKSTGGIERQPRTSLPLPTEIQNEILETFWDHQDIECSNPETLRACALTCKAWNKVARRHIFRVIILRSWEALKRLRTQMLGDKQVIGWVQRVRLCGSLPPFDKASAGQELPADWAIQDRWLYNFPSSLAERIRDKTSESYQPFNIRIFELFDFAHLSGAVEDCQWFNFWIQHLPWLENVDTLYLRSCEMAANAMVALAHCFPRLRRVGLTNVDFTANNYAHFRCNSSPYRSEEEILQAFAEACAHKGVDFEEAIRNRIPGNGVEYIGIHPPPKLESFYINNHLSQYTTLNLFLLSGWFAPCYVIGSLRSLELSSGLRLLSIAEFLRDMEPSPVLEHLWLWAGFSITLFKRYNFDVSKLTNLKSLGLQCGLLDPLIRDTFLHILSTLNAPGLQRVTLAFHHDKRCMDVKELDDCLAERFKNLELLVVECSSLHGKELDYARRDIQDMFPQIARRGMLRVQTHREPFRY